MSCLFGLRKYRDSLSESLKTKIYITFDEFKKLVSKYDLYCYDERCKQVLFINLDLEYDWLFIEIV